MGPGVPPQLNEHVARGCIFQDSCNSQRGCGRKNTKSHGMACGKEEATTSCWIATSCFESKACAGAEESVSWQKDRTGRQTGQADRPIHTPGQAGGQGGVAVRASRAGGGAVPLGKWLLPPKVGRRPKASDWPGREPQHHAWRSDSL